MTSSKVVADWVDIASRRSSTWWLLSRLVIEQPQDPWLSELEAVLNTVEADSSEPLGPESAALLSALQQARGEPDGFTALAVDRTRLLAGVLRNKELCGPYESAALGLDMNDDLVVDVAGCYRQAGLTDFGREFGPPDFLGTELRFMSTLVYQEMVAHKANDRDLVAQWLDMQRRFLDAHVLNWVPAHCARMADEAKSAFYLAISKLLGAACELDRRDLEAILKSTRTAAGELAGEVRA